VSRDRFIVVMLREQPQRCVQCIFQDCDSRMLCEAASDAYRPAGADRLRLDASARVTLRRLGYSQASARDNFSRTLALGSLPGVGIAADLMLSALHDAYGNHTGSVLRIEAPHGGDPGTTCGTPVS
jgi:hypothetical protein